MKVTVEIDCTPVEARTFFGLPDVTGLNEKLLAEMSKRLEANAAMLQPEELMRTWMTFGGQAQEQFLKMMTAAAASGLGSKPKPKA